MCFGYQIINKTKTYQSFRLTTSHGFPICQQLLSLVGKWPTIYLSGRKNGGVVVNANEIQASMDTTNRFVRAKIRTCLIVDSDTISAWQARALQSNLDIIDIVEVLYCTNLRSRKKFVKNFCYYFLNIFAIQNIWTKRTSWAPYIGFNSKIHYFEARSKGIWELIPEENLDQIRTAQVDLVIKFGMGLLRDPQNLSARYGVLSFHHGDPRRYRGRPSGFYELLEDAQHVGAVVQELSNVLDGGKIRAFGSYQITRHSYRKSLEHLYQQSAYLLRIAIENCLSESYVDISCTGKNYTLPSNFTVIRFVISILRRRARRMLYGLFFRKLWSVGSTTVWTEHNRGKSDLKIIQIIPKPRGVFFLADPFVIGNGSLLCEGSGIRQERGFLVRIGGSPSVNLLHSNELNDKHLSYPFPVLLSGHTFVLPEMAEHGPQKIFKLSDDDELIDGQLLLGLEDYRLIDPTLIYHSETWWLFAGIVGSEQDTLNLWFSQQPTGPFSAHKMNPVVRDPSKARGAGALFVSNGKLFRPGQNNCFGYGNGITISEVLQLDHDNYREEPVSTLSIDGLKGPHTYSANSEFAYVDFYQDKFYALAWYLRIKSRLN